MLGGFVFRGDLAEFGNAVGDRFGGNIWGEGRVSGVRKEAGRARKGRWDLLSPMAAARAL